MSRGMRLEIARTSIPNSIMPSNLATLRVFCRLRMLFVTVCFESDGSSFLRFLGENDDEFLLGVFVIDANGELLSMMRVFAERFQFFLGWPLRGEARTHSHHLGRYELYKPLTKKNRMQMCVYWLSFTPSVPCHELTHAHTTDFTRT